MGSPVDLAEQALDDLQEISAFISRRSREEAERFCTALIDKALSIGDFPQIGRLVPELGDPFIREIIHGSYRIVYELQSDPGRVLILRFWHAARGVPQPFG